MPTWREAELRPPTQGRLSLGERLREAGLIDQATLARVLELQRRNQRRLSELLLEQGILSPAALASVLSHHLNLPLADLRFVRADPAAIAMVPEDLAHRCTAVPLELRDNRLVVAMADPEDLRAVADLEAHTHRELEVHIAALDQVLRALDAYYQPGPWGGEVTGAAPSAEGGAGPAIQVVEDLVREALRERASDIHLEPQEGQLRVRFRVDGLLREAAPLPLALHDALLSRLKVLAGLNIAERRLPQDGQFIFASGQVETDVRLATIGTIYGEMAVLRLLDRTNVSLDLGKLGFSPQMLEQYDGLLHRPYGMILISGPTGSGKTTTLYASLNRMDRKGRNVITIEDPVEYRFPDINPIQVKEQVGVTFARSLRAALRLDPDVLLVGEVRDRETAQIAVQSALTGHLVLTSIHANDAVGVPFRLLDLGVEPFLLTGAIIGIIAQRMVRKVCTYCAEEAPATVEEEIICARHGGEEHLRLVRGRGCVYCAGSGFLGRTGVFELLTLDDGFKALLLKGGGAPALRRYLTEAGWRPMLMDGLAKAAAGVTTPMEVLRNVYSPEAEASS